MELIYQIQGLLIGIIGWAATTMLTLGSSRLSNIEQRAMIVCCWALWMIPALGSLVYRGLMTTQTAALACAVTTILLGVLAYVGASRWRTRP